MTAPTRFVSHLPPKETKNKVIFSAARVSSSSSAAPVEIIYGFLIRKQTTPDLGSMIKTVEGGRREEDAVHLLLLLLLTCLAYFCPSGPFSASRRVCSRFQTD